MGNKKNGAILCPGCRKLIDADAAHCPFCNLKGPGSGLRNNPFTRGLGEADGIIRAIIHLNIAVYVITILFNPMGMGMGLNPLTFLSPSSKSMILAGATGTYPIDGLGRWWTLVSANWIHGGLLHIFFNMMALRQIGPLVCREYGNYRMLAIYLITGVAGFFLSYLAGVRLTIGASAAVCGLVGAALYYGKSRAGSYGMAVYRQTGGWVLSIFLLGLVFPGINNWGHGGGLLAGILLGFFLGYVERSRETFFHKCLAGISVGATLAILLFALTTGFLYRFVLA